MRKTRIRFWITAAFALCLCMTLSAHAQAVSVSTWDELRAALANNSKKYYENAPDSAAELIQLSGNIRAQDGAMPLELANGSFAMIDLNGHDIDAASKLSDSSFKINPDSKLILSGSGSVRNGSATNGGAAYVQGGTLELRDSVQITGNTATGSGGGIYVCGEFYNSAGKHPSVFIMKGGSISGNTASGKGGGVYVDYSTFSISGKSIISGNSSDNVYINDCGTHIYIGGLTAGASIGVSHPHNSDFGSAYHFTSNGGSAYQSYFSSDDKNYQVKVDGGELQLEKIVYTVTFRDSISQAAYLTQNVGWNQPVSCPASSPTKAGYTFNGKWYADSGCATEWDFSTIITGDRSLYAGWTPKSYSIRFLQNDGSGSVYTTVNNFPFNVPTPLPADPTPAAGNTFLGWSRDASATAPTNYSDCNSVIVDGDGPSVDLYAVWRCDNCRVTFDGNGADMGPTSPLPTQDFVYGTPQDLLDVANIGYSLTNHHFLGWSTDRSASAASYSNKQSVDNFAGPALTLYAVWEIDKFTVTFCDDSGALLKTTPNVPYGSTLGSLSASQLPSKAGYHIDQWYKDQSLSEEWLSTYQVTADTTLYGKWEPNAYTVQFRANGGTGSLADQSFVYDEAQLLRAFDEGDISRANRTFLGWGTSAASSVVYTDRQSVGNLTTSRDGICTLYAVWGCTVTFETDGTPVPDQVLAYNTTVDTSSDKTKSTKAGYKPAEWYTDAGLNTKWNPGARITEDTKLYAKWEEQYWTVTFDVKGGSPHVNTQRVWDSTQIQKITTMPTKSGFDFGGWVTKADTPISVDYSTPIVGALVTGAPAEPDLIELEAVWTPIPAPAPAPAPSGGGGGGTPSITVPVSGDSSTVRASASLTGSSATVSDVHTTTLDRVIGKDVKTGDVTIDVTGLSRSIDSAKLPANNVKSIAAASNDSSNDVTGLSVKLSAASVNFDATALGAIASASGSSDLKLHVTSETVDSLNDAQRSAIAGLDADKILDAYVTIGDSRVSDFGGGNVTASVPFTVPAGKSGSEYVAYHVSDDGKLTKLPTSYEDGTLSFAMSVYSDYVIIHEGPTCPQDDTCPISRFYDASPTAWYHDGVHYVLENGLMSGYSAHQFAPEDTTTRGAIVTILWRLAGQPVVSYDLDYIDVPAGSWYEEAVRWAVRTGVAVGYSPHTFAPNDPITREQLATMLYNYARLNNESFTGTWTYAPGFPDTASVSSWAYTPMAWATMNGIISGMTVDTRAIVLSPQGNATRAQASTMLMRFCMLGY